MYDGCGLLPTCYGIIVIIPLIIIIRDLGNIKKDYSTTDYTENKKESLRRGLHANGRRPSAANPTTHNSYCIVY